MNNRGRRCLTPENNLTTARDSEFLREPGRLSCRPSTYHENQGGLTHASVRHAPVRASEQAGATSLGAAGYEDLSFASARAGLPERVLAGGSHPTRVTVGMTGVPETAAVCRVGIMIDADGGATAHVSSGAHVTVAVQPAATQLWRRERSGGEGQRQSNEGDWEQPTQRSRGHGCEPNRTVNLRQGPPFRRHCDGAASEAESTKTIVPLEGTGSAVGAALHGGCRTNWVLSGGLETIGVCP